MNEGLDISRRGKLVIIKHEHYEIEFNLSKGTWNYSNKTGKTVIKNAFTQIGLDDETSLKTSDTGFREFFTEPIKKDKFGISQTLCFTYETKDANEFRLRNDSQSVKDNTSNSEQNRNSQDKPDSSEETPTDSSNASDGIGVRIHTYLTCYTEHPYILLKVSVENSNDTPINLSNITLIDISAKQGAVQLGSHPSQYHLYLKMPPISPSASTHRKIYDGFKLNQDNTHQPCQEGILYDIDNKSSFLFGFISANRWWPRMQIGYKASKGKTQQGLSTWALYHDCEKKACPSGEKFTSEIGYLEFSEDITSSYARYTECLATENGVQTLIDDTEDLPKDNSTPEKHKVKNVSGWSISSDNISDGLSAKSISEQVRSIVKNPTFSSLQSKGLDYISLESGWQKNSGYLYLKPECFPNGMSSVVNEIHADGLKAGISIDPFCIESNSELLHKYPDICLVSNTIGKTRSKKNTKRVPLEVHLPGRSQAHAILDASHPKAKTHLRKVIKQLVDDWGFDLIKFDLSSYTSGMMFVHQNVSWHDSSLTSTELYRSAIRLLFDAVEDTERDVTLAGYNILESVCLGSFNLIYPLLQHKHIDSTESWHQQNGTKHRLSRYAGYLNSNKGLWQNVYGDLSVDEPRPINEAIVELTAAALSGAPVFCTNTPSSFSKLRSGLLAKIFPLAENSAIPIDRNDEILPQIWHLPVTTKSETWNLLGVFNWKDQQDDIHLDLKKVGLNPDKDYLVHDFWMRQYLGVVSKNVTLLNIIPRSARLLCLREEQQVPQLLSTDMHYTQGSIEILSAGWDENSQSYLLICQPPHQTEGSLFIHVPENYIPVSVSAYGSDYRYSWDKPIYQITFGETDSLIHASIQFTQTTGGSKDAK